MDKYYVIFKQCKNGYINIKVEASSLYVAVRKATKSLDIFGYAGLQGVEVSDYRGNSLTLGLFEFLNVNNFSHVIYSPSGGNIYGAYKNERRANDAMNLMEIMFKMYPGQDLRMVEVSELCVVPVYQLVEQESKGRVYFERAE